VELIRPAPSVTIDLKPEEVDVTDDHYHKIVFFTDGRQLQKPKDDSYQEIAAKWSGIQLVSDEKAPQGGKMSRTLELSPDGKQFIETFHVDRGKNRSPVIARYVYDIPGAQAAKVQAPPDPDQPVMKRRSDDAASTTQNPQAPSDQSSQTQATQAPQTQSSQAPQTQPGQTPQTQSAPDPDQPVMKRRTND
jgi:hypothetical protein